MEKKNKSKPLSKSRTTQWNVGAVITLLLAVAIKIADANGVAMPDGVSEMASEILALLSGAQYAVGQIFMRRAVEETGSREVDPGA